MATGRNAPAQDARPLRPADEARGTARDTATSPDVSTDAVTAQQVTRRLAADRAGVRRRNLVLAAILLVVILATLCQGVSAPGLLYSPADVLGCYAGWFRLNVVGHLAPEALLDRAAIIAAYPMYYEVTTRAAYTFITAVCGALLACSGMLYQNVFRNPIAAPTMLGVGNGVTCGLIVLVAVYGSSATYMTSARYLYSYLGGLAALVAVIALGRLASGRRGLDLVDMLLVGTVVSSLLGSVVNYVVNYLFNDSQWLAYYDLLNAMDLDTSGYTLALLGAAALVSIAPVAVLRFRMNCIAFPPQDMAMLGVRTAALRFTALASGSLMILTAQAFCGAVSMISLVVPFIARTIYGPEFGKQLVGNVLIGAIVLVVCRGVAALVPFAGTGLPLGTAVTFVTLPAFVWVMALAQKQWVDR